MNDYKNISLITFLYCGNEKERENFKAKQHQIGKKEILQGV